MTAVMTTKKTKKRKTPTPFPVELIDLSLATVQNKDAGSIPGESGLAGQLQKMLAERMLAAELTHHLASEGESSKNHRNGTSPKKALAPGVNCTSMCRETGCPVSNPSWWPCFSGSGR